MTQAMSPFVIMGDGLFINTDHVRLLLIKDDEEGIPEMRIEWTDGSHDWLDVKDAHVLMKSLMLGEWDSERRAFITPFEEYING